MEQEVKAPTLREQLREITGKLPAKKQKEIEEFLSYALSNSRIMLLEDLHREHYITQSVGIRYIQREVDFINAVNKIKEKNTTN